MRITIERLAALTLLATSTACAPTAARTSETTNREFITRAQMVDAKFLTVYDAVAAMHSNWLRPRGTNSLTSQSSEVRVYLDNTRLGDTTTLRTIAVSNVLWVRHYDGITATGRWGLDHGAGVIFVATHPAGPDSGDASRAPKHFPEP
jgi:hypothetical protein